MSEEGDIDLEGVFEVALQKAPGPERTAYLEAACKDPETRRQIERLLRAHDEAGGFLETPALGSASERERIGTAIDHYELLEVLGEGGMGVVYRAEQKEPVRRSVALKVIKLGMDTKQVLRRFDTESQALALMQHDNIAKVLDAGCTDDGRPYFVMEYVKGPTLMRYCDDHRLKISERLQVFQKICAGVQHAHQKGVLHRDLKPSNVLVATQDGKPVPKIIDFGLAKATDRHLRSGTRQTEQGLIFGTPEYMSPEQAGLSELDVDTRADIYSLGVVLYELLVGELPFSQQDLQEVGLFEFRRRIREDDPPKPTTRLIRMGTAGEEKARNRATDVRALARRLRGDLEWIVLKALEKDRNRRYSTAEALAEDTQRHLDHEPVEAGPPTAGYRMRKFVRRHRARLIAAGAVLVAIVGGVVGTTLGFQRAEEQAQQVREAQDSLFDARFDAERARVPAANGSGLAGFALPADSPADVDVLSLFGPLPDVILSRGDSPLDVVITAEQVDLGRQLFYDERLSRDQTISCNSCHSLENYGVDNREYSVGYDGQAGRRNAPTVYHAAGYLSLHWDGASANVEEQAELPILNPVEMAMPDEAYVVKVLQSIPGYVEAFEEAFPDDEEPITLQNTATAIAAFERGLVAPSRWDRYLEGDQNALSDDEKRGLNTFVDVRCHICHLGTYVGGQMLNRLGFMKPWPGNEDLGNYEVTGDLAHRFLFKVPSLRNVAETAPYLHDGSVEDLPTMVSMMAEYQLNRDISTADVESIVFFLEALTGEIPQEYIARPELPASGPDTPKPDR